MLEIRYQTLIQSAKLLFSNKYYVMISCVYILQQLYGAMIGVGIYFMTYVLHNKNLFGVFSWAINIPLILALQIGLFVYFRVWPAFE